MGREIERKFLVDPGRWRPGSVPGVAMRQGYLSLDPDRIVRVRRAGEVALLTIKGATAGFSRDEFEYPIPVLDADRLLDRHCHHPLIEKVRYRQSFAGHLWEIDVFDGVNRGLVLAEVELQDQDEAVSIPPWAVREVTTDPRYANAALIQHPFTSWQHAYA